MSTTEISDRIALNFDFVSVDGEDESHRGDGVSASSISDIGLEIGTVVDHSDGPMEGLEGLSDEWGNDGLQRGMDFGDCVSNLELEMEHVNTLPAMDGGDVVTGNRSMAVDDVPEEGVDALVGGISEITGNAINASNLFVDLNSCMDRAKSGNRVDALVEGVLEITGNEFKASNRYVDLSSCMDRAKSGNGVYILLEGVYEITGNEFNPSNLFVDLNSCMVREGNLKSGDGIGRERTKVTDKTRGELSKHKGKKNRFLGLDSFEPAKLIQCIKLLAMFLHSRVDRLEQATARAQVLAFNRSKGFSNLPKLKMLGELLEDDVESMLNGPQGSPVSTSNLVDWLDENSKVELSSPTALILKFSDFDSIPSVTSLKRVYSDFGPLNESGTKVLKKSCRAKLVFKRRSDAETAFSSPGKYKIFGPSLVSYSLKYLSSSPHPKKKHRKDPTLE